MPDFEIDSLDADAWFRRLFSGELKLRSPRGWRACHTRLMSLAGYRWIGGIFARLRARVRVVPMPAPTNCEIPMMGFRLCLWEPGSYVSTWKFIPGTKIELLMHMHCNRVVGLKIWD